MRKTPSYPSYPSYLCPALTRRRRHGRFLPPPDRNATSAAGGHCGLPLGGNPRGRLPLDGGVESGGELVDRLRGGLHGVDDQDRAAQRDLRGQQGQMIDRACAGLDDEKGSGITETFSLTHFDVRPYAQPNRFVRSGDEHRRDRLAGRSVPEHRLLRPQW